MLIGARSAVFGQLGVDFIQQVLCRLMKPPVNRDALGALYDSEIVIPVDAAIVMGMI